MGTVLAVLPCSAATPATADLFKHALRSIKATKNQLPHSTLATGWSSAASFPRWNGSGLPIFEDNQTSSWIAMAGTCFHASGDSSPRNLLQQYFSVGAERLGLDLEGFFVVFIGNGRTKELVVITDVVGSCHAFIRKCEGSLAVSTSALALAVLGDVALDSVACQEFLATGVVYEDRTFYQNVRKLPPASVIRLSADGQVDQHRYWELSRLTPESLSGRPAVDALWNTLTSAAAKINTRFSNIVCDLTGGYDSRTVAAAFLGAQAKFATAVSGPADSADVRVSRELAAMLGLKHLHCSSRAPIGTDELKAALKLTDGEYDLVEYASTLRVHRDLAQQFDISINGSFGEVARGYWWELLVPHTGARRKLDSGLVAARRYAPNASNALIHPDLRIDLFQHFADVIDRTSSGLYEFPNTFQMDSAYLWMRMQRWQGRIASSTDQLWPCLSPFMCRSVLEAMLQTTSADRKRSLLVRRVLAAYQPELAAYPLEHGYPALPATWSTLPKFWPVLTYYGGKIAQKVGTKVRWTKPKPAATSSRLALWASDEVRHLLDPASMKIMSITDPVAVKSFLESSHQDHFSPEATWNRVLSLEFALQTAAAHVMVGSVGHV